jgi:tetratricopeptide (TPR) repeat protein
VAEIISPQDLVKEAKKYYGRKNYIQAAELYRKAAESYRIRSDDTDAAEQMNNSSVAYLQSGNAQAALDAASGTDHIFMQNGDKVHQAMALANQAAALEELQRDPEALAFYQDSAALLKASNEREMRSQVMKKISALQIRAGNKMDATVSMYGALEDKEKLTGKEKPLKKLLDTLFGYMGINSK